MTTENSGELQARRHINVPLLMPFDQLDRLTLLASLNERPFNHEARKALEPVLDPISPDQAKRVLIRMPIAEMEKLRWAGMQSLALLAIMHHLDTGFQDPGIIAKLETRRGERNELHELLRAWAATWNEEEQS